MTSKIQELLVKAHKVFPIRGKGHHAITLNGESKPVLQVLIEEKNQFFWLSLDPEDFNWEKVAHELNDAREQIFADPKPGS